MKLILLIILLGFTNSLIQAKSIMLSDSTSIAFISDVFIQLPIESLSTKVKVDLLKFNLMDSIDDNLNISFNVDSFNNSIFFQSYPNGCRSCPCDNYSIMSYRLNDSIFKIVYSNSTNSRSDNFQNALDTYEYYLKPKKLIKDTIEYKAFKIKLKDFFKNNTPDSIISKYYSDNIQPTYSFRKDLIYCIISDYGYSNILLESPWLLGNYIEIKWNGKDFIIGKITLEK